MRDSRIRYNRTAGDRTVKDRITDGETADSRLVKKLLGSAGKLRIGMVAWGVCALVWSGLYYPELFFTEDTYQPVIVVDGEEIPLKEEEIESFFSENTFGVKMREGALCDLLRADADKILVRSRLVEWWKNLWRKD